MARIRTIKPSIWGDDKFSDLTRDARLLFIGIVSHADDKGRFIATPATLAGAIYPHDDIDARHIRKWLQQIADTGLVHLYEINGRSYGVLPNWRRHQRIDKPQPSALPGPPQADSTTSSENGSTTDSPTDSPTESENDSTTNSENHSTAEGKGMEVLPPNPPPSGGHTGQHDNCRRCGTNRRGAPKPTPSPPPWRPDADDACQTHLGQLAASCTGCAADAKVGVAT